MFQWRLLFIFVVIILTACSGLYRENNINNNTPDPSTQFIEAATFLEPISDPITTALKTQTPPPINPQSTIALPPVNPLTVSGNLVITTSPNIDPLNQLIYQRFVEQGYGGIIQFNQTNVDQAIQLFCQDKTNDLLAITRALQNQEIATCTANGRQPIEFPVGQNSFVIVVNPADTFVKRVTLSDLTAILTVENWSDVNPNWPKKPIQRFLIGPESAALDLIAERVFEGRLQPILNASNTRFYQFTEPLIQALSTTAYGVGLFNYRDYQRAAQSFRAISLEGAAATPQNAQNGTYPFNQTLFLYADVNQLQQKPQLSAFLNFYLTSVETEIQRGNYFPLTPTQINQARVNWLRAMGFESLQPPFRTSN